jgi:hypothetical protein
MKKTSRILTVLALAASSVLFATPSHAVPTVNMTLNCSSAGYVDQPVGDGWVLQVSITGCTQISSQWPFGTTAELKEGSTTVAPSSAAVQGTGSTGVMAITPYWNSIDPTKSYALTINLPNPLPAGFVANYAKSGTIVGGMKSGVGGFPTSSNLSMKVFYFVIDPSYVPGQGSTPTRVRGNLKATVDSVTFTDDGTGTGGSLSWKGTNIDSVLYSGPAETYPKAFNYGAYTSSWNGVLQNLIPDTTYTFDFWVNSIDDYSSMKSVTFKTGPAVAVTKDAAYWTRFVDSYVIYAWEAANMKMLMAKFNAIETSPYRSFIKVPTSRVSTWSATSLTPASCSVASTGVVTAKSADTCTVSYTVSGPSKAPVTLVRDFKFTRFVS